MAAPAKLPEVVHFNAWLYSIARNQAFDALKAMAEQRAASASCRDASN
jgi:DNA-directed RNA polymerase specialized sigma24 family protein